MCPGVVQEVLMTLQALFVDTRRRWIEMENWIESERHDGLWGNTWRRWWISLTGLKDGGILLLIVLMCSDLEGDSGDRNGYVEHRMCDWWEEILITKVLNIISFTYPLNRYFWRHSQEVSKEWQFFWWWISLGESPSNASINFIGASISLGN